MNEHYQIFLKESKQKAFDKRHREIINFNISKYRSSFKKGKEQFKNLDLAKKRAFFLKNKLIENLEEQLNIFETNFKKNGGVLIWANDAKEAIQKIKEIITHFNPPYVVKSKSMITEEINLNEELKKINIEAIETDLGEFIVQIANEKPYHIITPVMHKSREDIAKLFNEIYDLPENASAEEITKFVRKLLREKFKNAKVGITGANFLIADTGSIALTENEGNALLTTAFPKVQIVIAGFEKLIPSLKTLALYWPLLASHGTGQILTTYNSILSGPRKNNEIDGPENLYLIIIDNNRSNILKDKEVRQALNCIKCGACINECPVYRNIGGWTYKSVYPGPIGAVISPYLNNYDDYIHLSFASTLCGKCAEICPMNIDLPKLLLKNRNDFIKSKKNQRIERISFKVWKKAMKKRKIMDMGSAKFKNYLIRRFFKDGWGEQRTMPQLSEKSFNKMWREKNKFL